MDKSSSTSNEKPSENDIINNSRLEHLYNHSFGDGRFFQVVFADESETHIQLATKTMMKIVYLVNQDDIEGIEIIKFVSESEKERIKFSKFNFQQLRKFLDFINTIDLKGISNRRIVLAENTLDILDNETKKKIATLLSGNVGVELISSMLEDGLITSQDIEKVN
ncbi:MAG: hypothetical protein MUF58_00965 [Arcicella sp.]|jgi:hypothetical protein|nr:hypothetical protein [Arcicella sp.]